MKCMSCQTEINPQWKHAIDSNICPFCGQIILPTEMKNLFSTLRETMEQLSVYPEELSDWMLSNHQYIKTDSPNLLQYIPKDQLKETKREQDSQEKKKFIVKVKTEHGIEEVPAEKILSQEQTNEFFKRAGVIKKPKPPSNDPMQPPTFSTPAERTQYLKGLMQQIKKSGGTSVPMTEGTDIGDEQMTEMAEYQETIPDNNISSALMMPNQQDDELPYILAANRAAASSNGGNNAKDLMKLQQMYDKINSSRENFESGGNRGSGGFSRSG